MLTPEQKQKIRDAVKNGSFAAIDEVISELCEESRPQELTGKFRNKKTGSDVKDI